MSNNKNSNSIKTLDGRIFSQELDQSILSAAESNNIFFPYSCRTGRCSSCKCKLISGETSLVTDELGLSKEEKEEGWILSCVRNATTDITIDIEDLGDVEIPKSNTHPCKISKINNLTYDVLQVFLRFPPNINFKFIPGQYVDIIGPNRLKRSYSIANNFQNNLIELHIKKVSNGAFSDYWFNRAKVDDLLRIYGPRGTFFVRDKLENKIIFLATGTGIAPILSMIGGSKIDLFDPKKDISIFWGVRTNEDLYMHKLQQLDKFNFVPVLSKPCSNWKGIKGYVQDALLSNEHNLDDAVVYACGSDAMIKSAEKLLIENGLKSNNFYSDAFLPSSSI